MAEDVTMADIGSSFASSSNGLLASSDTGGSNTNGTDTPLSDASQTLPGMFCPTNAK